MKLLESPRALVTNILSSWRQLQTNWLINIVGKIVVILGLVSLILLVWSWRGLPPTVPLWYSRPWGDERLASPWWLLLLPLGSFLWLGVNIIIATFIARDYPVFTRVLFLSSMLVSFMAFVTLAKIIFLVT